MSIFNRGLLPADILALYNGGAGNVGPPSMVPTVTDLTGVRFCQVPCTATMTFKASAHDPGLHYPRQRRFGMPARTHRQQRDPTRTVECISGVNGSATFGGISPSAMTTAQTMALQADYIPSTSAVAWPVPRLSDSRSHHRLKTTYPSWLMGHWRSTNKPIAYTRAAVIMMEIPTGIDRSKSSTGRQTKCSIQSCFSSGQDRSSFQNPWRSTRRAESCMSFRVRRTRPTLRTRSWVWDFDQHVVTDVITLGLSGCGSCPVSLRVNTSTGLVYVGTELD